MYLPKQILLVLVLLSVYAVAQTSSEDALTEILCSVNFPNRPEICTAIYAPVCASYPKQCFAPPCPQYQDFPSNCVACQDLNVPSYRPGVCVFTCEANVTFSSIDQSFNPVCAIYEEGCNNATCRQSFRNSNEACQSSNVVSFTNGVCEGDVIEDLEETISEEETAFEEEMNFGNEEAAIGEEDDLIAFVASISCSDPRPEICNNLYQPVCVIECADGNCRRTVSNPCSACSDSNVLAYTPQSCEAERIQCPMRDFADSGALCSDLWDPVCAYSTDCTGDSCAGVTSSNDCNACYTQGADYYIRGECLPQ